MNTSTSTPSFHEVAEFVRRFTGCSSSKIIIPQTRLEADLGITGDDGGDLLLAAASYFNVQLVGSDGYVSTFGLAPNEYLFHSEGIDLFGFFRWLFGRPRYILRKLTVGELHEAICQYRLRQIELPNNSLAPIYEKGSSMAQRALWYIWDEDYTDRVFAIIAAHHGYHLTHLTTFQAALARLSNEQPQLIIAMRSLMDVDDGIAFCRYIRAQKDYQHLPIILGFADLDGKRFADTYDAGANGCFGRVFDIEKIFAMVVTLEENPLATHLFDQPEWRPRK